MIHSPTPTVLPKLRNASSPSSQIEALRELKNEIIGHEEKKESILRAGAVGPLSRILVSSVGAHKKKQEITDDLSTISLPKDGGEEEVCCQAIIIIGSLARGGPAFIPPLYSGRTVAPLLAASNPSISCSRVVFQALKALNALADSAQLCHPTWARHDLGVSHLLYSLSNGAVLRDILLQDGSALAVRQRVELVCHLIIKTDPTEHQRALLVQCGLLEALAKRIAPIVALTCSLRDSDTSSTHLSKHMPGLRLAVLLKAVCTIVKGSMLRALQFLKAPDLDGSIFSRRQQSNGSQLGDDFSDRGLKSSATSESSRALPTDSVHGLGTPARAADGSRSRSSGVDLNDNQTLTYLGDDQNGMIVWLIYIFRSRDTATRLAAADILVTLSKLGLVKRARAIRFRWLMVPPLVGMLERNARFDETLSSDVDDHQRAHENAVASDEAPAILAMLMANNPEVQSAVKDAGAIKHLAKLLKESFDQTSTGSSGTLWTAEPAESHAAVPSDGDSQLGEPGIPRALFHKLRLRESVLLALATLASDKEEYRKEIIENGVIPLVIESIKPPPVSSSSRAGQIRALDSSELTTWYRDSFLAACAAAKALSRSVTSLRTSLMDAGLVAPLFALLKNPDVDIRVAATTVVTNLVMDFSALRGPFMDGGIRKILCEQAHSTNAKLRLNSLWAIKHIIIGGTLEEKQAVLAELGPSWLKQMLLGDNDLPAAPTSPPYQMPDDGGTTPIRMNTANAAGEQVDLLNADTTSSGQFPKLPDDVVMSDSSPASASGEDSPVPGSSERTTFASGDLVKKASQLPQPFSMSVYDTNSSDQAQSLQGLNDQIAIQKEGLDILRNLTCSREREDSPKMLDHVFDQFGVDMLFEILLSKLRPVVSNAFQKDRRSLDIGVRQVHPRADIIVSACYIIVHIAAGVPRHRHLLIKQMELLKLLVPLFSHSMKDIRSACSWIAFNLVWVEDSQDRMAARQRALELKKLGFLEKLEQMESDESLDCRERSKQTRDAMRSLLGR